MHVDNQGSIDLAHNAVLHGRAKHIEVHWHFIRQVIEVGKIIVQKVQTALQNADFLTKPLAKHAHLSACIRVGLVGSWSERPRGGVGIT